MNEPQRVPSTPPIDPAEAAAKLQEIVKRGVDKAVATIADDVGRLGVVFVNLYVVTTEQGYVLIDTGLPGFKPLIRQAVEAFVGDRACRGIVLTHGHFDHAGNVAELARDLGVPVYAHRLEMPYLTGGSDYAPADPTPGGAICMMSRVFPTGGYDLSDVCELRALDGDGGEIDGGGLPGWRWLHTPGHARGHVSLYREADGLLIAGDALATMDLDSWTAQVSRERRLCRPATPFTPDWVSARRSVHRLAELRPMQVAAGHGLPMKGRFVSDELWELDATMQPPPGGRYTDAPATYADDGRLLDVPPPVEDKPKKQATIGGLATLAAVAAGAGLLALALRRR